MKEFLEYGVYKFIKLQDNKLKLTKYRGQDKTVKIPSRVMYYTVSEIGSSAFAFNSNIADVLLPPTVEIIETGSFSECVNLKKINIPPLVGNIERLTFEDCLQLEYVIFENKECNIEENAFINSSPEFIYGNLLE